MNDQHNPGINPGADHADTGSMTPKPSTVPNLPLILEQIQDQLDQLRSIAETQQTVIEAYETRLAAVEHQLAALTRP